jgi:GTP-binding protein HflX
MIAARDLQAAGQSAERAVLVAVEFTGERRKLTSAARLSRKAATVSADCGEDEIDAGAAPAHAAGLDFEASLAEFKSGFN